MTDKNPSFQWIENELTPYERSRFLVIFHIAKPLENGLAVARAVPPKAASAFRDAAHLIEAMSGILLDNRIYADGSRICVRAERDDSMLPDVDSLPKIMLRLLPSVQELIDAWRDSVVSPGIDPRRRVEVAQASFSPGELLTLTSAILSVSATSPKQLDFGELGGTNACLQLPPKQQLRPASTYKLANSPEDEYLIESIDRMTILSSEIGVAYLIRSEQVAPGIGPGVIVQLVRAGDPSPMKLQTAERIDLVTAPIRRRHKPKRATPDNPVPDHLGGRCSAACR